MMKKTIFILSLATFTGLSAQNTPIQVEIVDRTEITMLAAQHDVMMREKRQAMNAKNYDIAIQNFSSFTSNIGQLKRMTTDPKILKQLEKAHAQNERLFDLANRSSYSREFYKLQNNIKRIGILLNAYQEPY